MLMQPEGFQLVHLEGLSKLVPIRKKMSLGIIMTRN
jgi:hypothetical protein